MRLNQLLAVALIVSLLLGAIVIYFIPEPQQHTQNSTDSITINELVKNENRIQWLVISETDDTLQSLYLFSYEPISNRTSAVFLPTNSRIQSPSFGRDRSLADLYESLSINDFKDELSRTLQISIHHWIKSTPENYRKLVDLIGGMELNFPVRPTQSSNTDTPVNSSRWVDGVLAKKFLSTTYTKFGTQGRRFRHKMSFLAIMNRLKKAPQLLQSDQFFNRVSSLIQTNLNRNDLRTTVRLLLDLNPDQIKFPGGLRNKGLNSPQQLDIKQVQNMIPEPLKQIIRKSERKETIKVQVLNGAGIKRLASSARDYLQKHDGVDVVTVGNTDEFDHTETLIIDRKDHPKSADRIRKILGTGQIRSEPSDDLMVDITVIAGEDLKSIIYR